MSVMIVRFIDLPKKGCFAEFLKRPTPFDYAQDSQRSGATHEKLWEHQ